MRSQFKVGDIIRYYRNNHHGIIVGVKEENNHFLYYVDWFHAANKPLSYRATQLVKVSE